MTGLQRIERIDGDFAPAAEIRLARALSACKSMPAFTAFALSASLRDFADGGDAGVDEHDLLAGRGIGVEFFVAAMEALLDLVDQRGRIPVETIERHVDLKNLLAIAHLGGAFDRRRAR